MDLISEQLLQSTPAKSLHRPLFKLHQVQSVAKLVTDENFSDVAFNLQSIFTFCVVLYGSLGALWLAYSKIPKQDVRYAWLHIGLLCITWAAMSVGMHVLNKTLVVALNAPALITIFQMVVACSVMLVTSWRQLAQANRKELLIWLVVPGFFAMMLITSFYTYHYITLSLLTVVRNLAPLVVFPIESIVMPAGKAPKVSKMGVFSMMIMLAGALLYGFNLEDISWTGISFAFMNMVLACSDRMLQRRLLSHDCSSLPLQVCTIMNNAIGMLPTFALAFFTAEIDGMMGPQAETVNTWTDPRILVLLLISGGIGLGICYFGFACQRVISATSFMVLQNTSKIAVVTMGICVFHDPIRSPYMLLGLLLSCGGTFLYGKASMDLQDAEKLEKMHLVNGQVQSP